MSKCVSDCQGDLKVIKIKALNKFARSGRKIFFVVKSPIVSIANVIHALLSLNGKWWLNVFWRPGVIGWLKRWCWKENCEILLFEKNQKNSRDMHYIEDKARGTWSKVVKDLKVHIYWKRKQVNLFILWLFPNFFRNSSNSYGVYTLWGQFLLLLFTS